MYKVCPNESLLLRTARIAEKGTNAAFFLLDFEILKIDALESIL